MQQSRNLRCTCMRNVCDAGSVLEEDAQKTTVQDAVDAVKTHAALPSLASCIDAASALLLRVPAQQGKPCKSPGFSVIWKPAFSRTTHQISKVLCMLEGARISFQAAFCHYVPRQASRWPAYCRVADAAGTSSVSHPTCKRD